MSKNIVRKNWAILWGHYLATPHQLHSTSIGEFMHSMCDIMDIDEFFVEDSVLRYTSESRVFPDWYYSIECESPEEALELDKIVRSIIDGNGIPDLGESKEAPKKETGLSFLYIHDPSQPPVIATEGRGKDEWIPFEDIESIGGRDFGKCFLVHIKLAPVRKARHLLTATESEYLEIKNAWEGYKEPKGTPAPKEKQGDSVDEESNLCLDGFTKALKEGYSFSDSSEESPKPEYILKNGWYYGPIEGEEIILFWGDVQEVAKIENSIELRWERIPPFCIPVPFNEFAKAHREFIASK